jgi:hypothetical protein
VRSQESSRAQDIPRAIPQTIGVEINRWLSKKTKPRVLARKSQLEIFDSRLSTLKKTGIHDLPVPVCTCSFILHSTKQQTERLLSGQLILKMTDGTFDVNKSDSVIVMSEPQIPVIPFAVALSNSALQSPGAPTLKNSLVGDNGIVGTIILMRNSVMVWVGWGKLDVNPSDVESSDVESAFATGNGRPPQGQCLVAMPRTGYKGAFGTGSKEAPCSQLIGSASSDDQMLAAQMASRLSTRSSMAVFVSCQLSSSSGNDADEWNAGIDSEVLSHRAAAMAEKEIWRILQTKKEFET